MPKVGNELLGASADEIRRVKEALIEVPDFPKPGILFQDITPLLLKPAVYETCVQVFARRYEPLKLDVICGLESRGFLFGCVLAHTLKLPFVPIRKANKLPRATLCFRYQKEYGEDQFHIHADALKPQQRVLIVDDLVATGGTAEAAVQLVRMAKAVPVEMASVVELKALKGREAISVPVFSIVSLEE